MARIIEEDISGIQEADYSVKFVIGLDTLQTNAIFKYLNQLIQAQAKPVETPFLYSQLHIQILSVCRQW